MPISSLPAPPSPEQDLSDALALLSEACATAEDLESLCRRVACLFASLTAAAAACVLLAPEGRGPLEVAGHSDGIEPAKLAIAVAEGAEAIDKAWQSGETCSVTTAGTGDLWAVPLQWAGGSPGVLLAVGAAAGVPAPGAEEAARRFARGAAAEIEGRLAQERRVRAAEERGCREVERLQEELRDASVSREQLLAVLSHELRNPMSAVLAGVQVLQSAVPADSRAYRALEILERNAHLQARLVNDLLDFARISRGKLTIHRAPLLLGAVVQSAVHSQQDDADEGGITLEVDLEPDVWAEGDFDRLQQMVMNLIANAVKFTASGGRVRVKCSAQGNGMGRVDVEDTGIGISPALLPHLFEMFRQGEVAGRRAMGLGIGLALVRSIAEMHDGRAWAESNGLGCGSRFSVELPLVACPEFALAEDDEERRSPVDVLLVEDTEDTRVLVAQGLETLACSVRTAASGEEALALLGEGRPDVIVADLGLPGIDGCELLRRAHAMAGMETTPALAVSASALERDLERARAAGFREYLTKPVDVAVLNRAIRRSLREISQTRQSQA